MKTNDLTTQMGEGEDSSGKVVTYMIGCAPDEDQVPPGRVIFIDPFRMQALLLAEYEFHRAQFNQVQKQYEESHPKYTHRTKLHSQMKVHEKHMLEIGYTIGFEALPVLSTRI